MSWFRYFSRFVFKKWEGKVSPEKAERYMAAARFGYFFSATTLLLYVYRMNKEAERLKEEEEERKIAEEEKIWGKSK